MSYSLNTRGCVPAHAHYSNQPKCFLLAVATSHLNVIEFEVNLWK